MENPTQSAEQNEPSSLKHDGPTPGPWRACIEADYVQSETTGYYVAEIFGGMPNALLIAAAPDMLAALQGLIGCLGDGGYFPAAGLTKTNAARAAIAKATGAA